MTLDSQIEAMLKKQEANTVRIERRCNICKKDIIVSSGHSGHYSGRCGHCGWYNYRNDGEFPDRVIYINMVSYNRAKKLVAEGKPLKPLFDEFIEGLRFYKEVMFIYSSISYGVMWSGRGVEFYEFDVLDGFQTYKAIDEFKENAHISGVLLKDIWYEIENADYM